MDAPAFGRRLRKPPSKVSRLLRRWSLGPAAKDKIERWQELAQTGEMLASVLSSPAWQAVLDAKGYYQARADTIMRHHSLPEATRLQAAIEWATLEGFFRELTNRVRHGRQAREALAKVQEPRTTTS